MAVLINMSASKTSTVRTFLKLFPVYAAYCLYSCVMRTVVLPCLCCLYLICCNSVYAPFSPAFTLPYKLCG